MGSPKAYPVAPLQRRPLEGPGSGRGGEPARLAQALLPLLWLLVLLLLPRPVVVLVTHELRSVARTEVRML